MTSDLVRRAQHGDPNAFEALIRPAYDRLFATAYRILRQPDLADDAVQDTVVRCWRELRGLRQVDRFEAWLYRLLVNACRDHLRNAKRRPPVAFNPLDHPDAADAYVDVLNHDALDRAFAALPADQRIVLVLTHYLGYSAPEIGAALGIPVGTVYSRLHYGTRAMRGALAPPAGGAPSTESLR